jgi:hypothetical protein
LRLAELQLSWLGTLIYMQAECELLPHQLTASAFNNTGLCHNRTTGKVRLLAFTQHSRMPYT